MLSIRVEKLLISNELTGKNKLCYIGFFLKSNYYKTCKSTDRLLAFSRMYGKQLLS